MDRCLSPSFGTHGEKKKKNKQPRNPFIQTLSLEWDYGLCYYKLLSPVCWHTAKQLLNIHHLKRPNSSQFWTLAPILRTIRESSTVFYTYFALCTGMDNCVTVSLSKAFLNYIILNKHLLPYTEQMEFSYYTFAKRCGFLIEFPSGTSTHHNLGKPMHSPRNN